MSEMAEYMKWLKGRLSLATGTLGTLDIPTPVQRGQGRGHNLGMAIHKIEFSVEGNGMVDMDADGDGAEWALTKTTPAAIPVPGTADLVAHASIYKAAAAGGECNVALPQQLNYYPPLLIANEKLVFSAIHTCDTTVVLTVRIGYTIRAVSSDELYAALNNQ
ncbi:MAG: hypothetical protein H7836_16075 [Magnetococcus sp. YQC-3]